MTNISVTGVNTFVTHIHERGRHILFHRNWGFTLQFSDINFGNKCELHKVIGVRFRVTETW